MVLAQKVLIAKCNVREALHEVLGSKVDDRRTKAEVLPGLRNQIGLCTGLRMGDHRTLAWYIIRVGKMHG